MTTFNLAFALTPEGVGSIQRSPLGDIVGFTPPTVAYPSGTVVTLNAYVYINGYFFDHWEGNASGTLATTTVTMNSNKSVTAVFKSTIPITPGSADVAGQIRDSFNGLPLAGVNVSCAGVSTISDQNGDYVLFNLPIGQQTVTFAATGFITHDEIITLFAGDNSITLSMERLPGAPPPPPPPAPTLADVNGFVLDGSGKGVPDAIVNIGSFQVRTLADGSYALNGLTPATYTIIVVKSGYTTYSRNAGLVAGNNTINISLAAVPSTIQTAGILVTFGTYNIGDNIPFKLTFNYKGLAQGVTVLVEIGHGILGTFTLDKAMAPFKTTVPTLDNLTLQTINGVIVAPSGLTPGNTYSVRATVTTDDGAHASDTNFGAFTMANVSVPSTQVAITAISIVNKAYAPGDALPIAVTYNYKGIAQGAKVQVIIGHGVAIFTTVLAMPEQAIQLDVANSLATRTLNADIVIPTTISADNYSAQVSITTADGVKSTSRAGQIIFTVSGNTTGNFPTPYVLVKDNKYPYGTSYNSDGSMTSPNAEEATAEINVPLSALPTGDWITQQAITLFDSKLAENGGHMLELQVFQRQHDATSNDYKIIATSSVPPAIAGQQVTPKGIVDLQYVVKPQVGFFAWALIILAILIAVGFLLTIVVPSVRQVVWGQGGLVQKVGNTIGSIGDIIGPLVMVMIISMMMEMMQGMMAPAGAPPQPKPVTTFVITSAEKVGKAVVSGGKKLLKEFKPGESAQQA